MKLHKLLCIAACAIPGLSCAVTDSLLDYRSLAYVEDTVPQPVTNATRAQNETADDCLVFATGDLLFWKTRRASLDYVVVNDSPKGATVYAGDVKNVEMDYDLGFRFGLGLDCRCWDFRFNTIQFCDKNQNSVTRDDGQTLFATRVHPDRQANSHNANFERASSQFGVDLSVYDLMVGHSIRNNCGIIVHIMGGLRHLSLDQELKTEYRQEDDDVTRVCENYDTSAWGLVSQVDFLWNMSERLGLIGRAGGSLMSGCSDSRVYERDFENIDEFQALNVDLRNDESRVIGTLELMAGLHLRLLDRDSFKLALEGGYEWFSVFNNGDFPQGVDDSVNAQLHRNVGVVGFDGAFVRLWGAF